MPGRHLLFERRLGAAAIHRDGTARVEVTSLRWIKRARKFAFYRLETPFSRLYSGYFGQKRLRVGVIGAPEDFLDRSLFDDPAEIHDRDAV
jgi:hypothetical protein